MKPWPFYLLEPEDRLLPGDLFVQLDRGNVPKPAVCDPSWRGTPVRECPEGVYLRRIPVREKEEGRDGYRS